MTTIYLLDLGDILNVLLVNSTSTKKWNVFARWVINPCVNGCILEVTKNVSYWAILEDAEKTSDTCGKYVRKNDRGRL